MDVSVSNAFVVALCSNTTARNPCHVQTHQDYQRRPLKDAVGPDADNEDGNTQIFHGGTIQNPPCICRVQIEKYQIDLRGRQCLQHKG